MKVQSKKNKVQNNIVKLFFVLIGVFCVLVGRYGWVQIAQGEQMMERLKGQVQEESVLHVPRGTIYDANMKEMAISTMVSSLFVDPNHTENPEQVATELAPLLAEKADGTGDDEGGKRFNEAETGIFCMSWFSSGEQAVLSE